MIFRKNTKLKILKKKVNTDAIDYIIQGKVHSLDFYSQLVTIHAYEGNDGFQWDNVMFHLYKDLIEKFPDDPRDETKERVIVLIGLDFQDRKDFLNHLMNFIGDKIKPDIVCRWSWCHDQYNICEDIFED